jgi:hypothetical protein
VIASGFNSGTFSKRPIGSNYQGFFVVKCPVCGRGAIELPDALIPGAKVYAHKYHRDRRGVVLDSRCLSSRSKQGDEA